ASSGLPSSSVHLRSSCPEPPGAGFSPARATVYGSPVAAIRRRAMRLKSLSLGIRNLAGRVARPPDTPTRGVAWPPRTRSAPPVALGRRGRRGRRPGRQSAPAPTLRARPAPTRVALHPARVGGRRELAEGPLVAHRRDPAQRPAGLDADVVAPAPQLRDHRLAG